MCPSFQATKDEHNSTRARANMLREIIINNSQTNKFDSKELYDILDLCLSCKGCKTECPSGIDMAKLKSEQKQCIELFYYQKLCYQEIAEQLKMEENKVKSFLQNGKRNLKICLEDKNVR